MTVVTLVRFLLFDRRAIDRIANCRGSLWLGFAFVLLAAVARDYDGVYLPAHPMHLLVPAAASFVTANLVYWLTRFYKRFSQVPMSFRQFLSLFWLTGPMAWLYAIPVERWNSAVNAAEINLTFLAVVSAWRVLLISRVLSHRDNIGFLPSVARVLIIADTVVLLVLWVMPLPVLNFMGGIHLSERDQLIRSTATSVCIVSILLWPLAGLLALAIPGNFRIRLSRKGPQKNEDTALDSNAAVAVGSEAETPSPRVGTDCWCLVAALSVLSIFLLSEGQPEQRLRHHAEELLRSGRLDEGLAFVSQHDLSDFPPHWTTPPAIGWGESQPNPIDLAYAAHSGKYKPWITRQCFGVFEAYFGKTEYSGHNWWKLDSQRLVKALTILTISPLISDEFRERAAAQLSDFVEEETGDEVRDLIRKLRGDEGNKGGETKDPEKEAADTVTQQADC